MKIILFLQKVFSIGSYKKTLTTILFLIYLSLLPNIHVFSNILINFHVIHIVALTSISCILYYIIISLNIIPAILSLLIITLLNSIAIYAIKHLGISINYSLYFDILGNNFDEIIRYSGTIINIGVLPYIFFISILPITLFIFLVRNNYIYHELSIIIFVRIIILVLLVVFGTDFVRNKLKVSVKDKSNTRYITSQFVPNNYLSGAFKYYQKQRRVLRGNLTKIATDAKINYTSTKDHLNVILIIGESARSDHFSLNGYPRNTNKLLTNIKDDIVSIKNFVSCSTSTWHSVPCIFSRISSNDFSLPVKEENILDVLSNLSIKTYWRSTQGSCVTTCDSLKDKKISLNDDQDLLLELHNILDHNKNSDKLIILHHNGSHYPYYPFFKKKHQEFEPFCEKQDFISLCSNDEIINAYDNTIISTDEFIFNVIDLANKYENSLVIYTSDHGQSLGENGIYIHNMPKIIAPKEQLNVPLVFWVSQSLKNKFKIHNINKNKQYSHDNLFHTLLGIFNIETKDYNKNLDMLSH